jgi:5-enolpyruvylshikimate-3-phosphate synthase
LVEFRNPDELRRWLGELPPPDPCRTPVPSAQIKSAVGGGVVTTQKDHRIAIVTRVFGLAADKPVKVDDAAFVATSFPSFADLMRGLGGDLQ